MTFFNIYLFFCGRDESRPTGYQHKCLHVFKHTQCIIVYKKIFVCV
jgi:hypothetical protein